MTPSGGISQTPSTPFSDKFCIFCSLTGDALARFFQYPYSNEIPPPEENLSSEKSLSRVAGTSDGDASDQHPNADGCLASVSIDNFFVSEPELQTKSQVDLDLFLTITKTSNINDHGQILNFHAILSFAGSHAEK